MLRRVRNEWLVYRHLFPKRPERALYPQELMGGVHHRGRLSRCFPHPLSDLTIRGKPLAVRHSQGNQWVCETLIPIATNISGRPAIPRELGAPSETVTTA